MAQGFDFICPTCLMLSKHQAKLNSIRDIAYSMPDELFQKLRIPLEREHGALTSEMNKKSDLICCITWEDIEKCLKNKYERGTVLRGTYILTGGWLKENAKRFGLEYIALDSVPDDMILLDEELVFYYKLVDGFRFPERIRNADEELLSDERRCAKCGRLLPPDTGKAEELRILLQGSSRAGKTSCIIAVFDYLLRNNYLEPHGLRAELTEGEGPNADDVEHYHNWIKRELEYYRQDIKVEKTNTAQNKPVVYSLLVKLDSRELVLSFVDMPGEYFDKADEELKRQEKLLKQYMPIYELCDVIWTCLRYETLVTVKNRSKEEWEKLEEDSGLTEALANFAEYEKYYRRFSQLIEEFNSRRSERRMVKHAVILTMTDSIVSVYNPTEEECKLMRDNHIIPAKTETEKAPELVVCKDRDKHMVFQEKACHNLCRRVSSYVQNKNSNLHKLFARFSEQTKYFAIAAYGHPALARPSAPSAAAATGRKPDPYQVEVPLLWSLAIGGHLPIEYKAVYYRKVGLLRSYREKKTLELEGEKMNTCKSFRIADAATRQNLLRDEEEYREHTVTLKRGESL